MTREIKKVTVIGAGVMGAGIAAHLANAGVDVNLLDIVLPNETDRNKISKAGVERMLKADLATDPFNAGFMDKRNASRIFCGNSENDFERCVKESDWVIEVIKEDLKLKQGLFARIEAANPNIIVTSNTSTIPLSKLAEGRSDEFKKNFAISHWFNPPRMMRLMELVHGPEISPEVLDTIDQFCDVRLGKKVIHCNDRPGFVANRIGTFFLARAIQATQEAGLKIEEVDSVLSRPMGFPKSGVFGLIDVVGVGLVPQVTKSLKTNLPADDMFVKQFDDTPKFIDDMLADGRTGRLSPKGGFYRMQRQANGSKVKEALDLTTGQYRTAEKPKLKSAMAGRKGPRAVFETDDKAGKFAWDVMRDTLCYALSIVPDVTTNIADVDAGMREGYQWKFGPFEMVDKIGPQWFADKLKAEGREIPQALSTLLSSGLKSFYAHDKANLQANFKDDMKTAYYAPLKRPAGTISLSDIKQSSKPVLTNTSASVWDIGDGVLCLEFHSKMNSLDPLILKMINDTIRTVNKNPDKYKALVIHNESTNFSVGANLGLAELFLRVADHRVTKALHLSGLPQKGLAAFIGELIFQGQAAYKALREAPFPVIGACSGMALGGGCEILLHCDRIQADAESYIGLVEAGVGIIPGWGGNVRLLERAQEAGKIKGPIPALREAAMTIMNPPASISASAQDAKSKLWLRPQDGISMNRDRLLADAKSKALELVPGYVPPKPAVFRLSGEAGKNALRMAVDGFYVKGGDPNRGGTTWYDVVVGEAVAHALSGGDVVKVEDSQTHISSKLETDIAVNPSMLLTEARMLQMERDAFMALIHRPETQKRISTMIATNKPYRESMPDPAPEPSAIRAGFQIAALDRRDPTGKPVEGRDARNLERLAKVTATLFRLFPKLAA